MTVRAAYLGALAVVLASGALLLLHGASAKAVPGVALSSPPAPHAAPPAKGGHSGHSAQAKAVTAAAKQSHGPLLASTQIAPFTYEVYPTPGAQLGQAEAGFQISVRQLSAIERKVVITNQLGGVTALQQNFLASDRAYWIETNYGDDAPGQDANLGDDGFVLTDAQGYITQK